MFRKLIGSAAFAGAALFVLSASASADDAPTCPTVRVTGSQSGTNGALFTANVSGGDFDPTYNWAVSNGGITSGQGTSTITVGDVAVGQTVTATVEVGGAPPDCYSTDSSTVEIFDQAQ